jgi:hypothetical protein
MYFREPRWRLRLKAMVKELQGKDMSGGFETLAERQNAIQKDLEDSKREIERRLPGKKVRHFSYPWYVGSALTSKLLARSGYVSNAWGGLLPKFVHGLQGPVHIARFSSPYLWRLPGKGRKPIGKVISERLSHIVRKLSRY